MLPTQFMLEWRYPQFWVLAHPLDVRDVFSAIGLVQDIQSRTIREDRVHPTAEIVFHLST